LNVAQLAIVIVAGLTWNRWFAGGVGRRMSEHVGPIVEGAIDGDSIHHEVGVHDFNYGDITWWVTCSARRARRGVHARVWF